MNREELAARLLETFIAELDDQVAALNRHLLVLEVTPESVDDRRAAFRVLHTLKGAARAAGVPLVEATCHRLESLLAQLRDETRVLDAATLALLFRGADALADAAKRLRARESLEDAPIAALSNDSAANDSAANVEAAPVTVIIDTAAAAATTANTAQPSDTGAATGPAADATQNSPAVAADVRVRAEQLDALLGASSRLLIAGGRVESLEESLEELRISVSSAILGRRTAAAPELRTHVLEETLRNVARDLQRLALESSDTARAVSLVSTDINTGVRALRLRPFADAVGMLPRLVRDAALETEKDVQLDVVGDEVHADRTVLDEIREAVLHLVRNAVAHGIEPAAVRTAQGKPAAGTVRVAAQVVSDHLLVIVSDDGAGIDIPALRSAMERRGEEVPNDDNAIVRRLFEGGLSTRNTADAIAGRGVGLDAVRAAMARVRGSVNVSWRVGIGTTFTLEAPVALATIRAVLACVGRHVVAVPSAYIERLLRVRTEAVREANGRSVITLGDAPVPLVSMARLLGPPLVERPPEGVLQIIVLASGGRRVAVMVDDLTDEDEIVVRPIINKGRRELPFVSGAALLRTGKVAIVANIGALVTAGAGNAASMVIPTASPSAEKRRCRILVADDSITTRTLEQSVLETAGYQVITAVDGADAWRLLQEDGADLVVSDVEMPRMDGFALCQAIRASSRFRELPVILVTALETATDRERGIEAGADAYLAKSSFDQENLLDTIRQLIG